jgi:hypothetical protein
MHVNRKSRRALILLAALTLVLPRLLVAPGYMPGLAADGYLSVVACDPDLRAAMGDEHAHHHGHSHADAESCPFGMSGAPALASVAQSVTPAPDAGSLLLPTDIAAIAGERLPTAHRARAPPSV